MDDESLLRFAHASDQLHRAKSLVTMLDTAVEAMRKLVDAELVTLVGTPFVRKNITLPKVASPVGAIPDPALVPDLSIKLIGPIGREFAAMDIYMAAGTSMDETSRTLAQHFGRTVSIAVVNTGDVSVSNVVDERFKDFVDLSREGYWAIGSDLRVTYVNRAMAALVGEDIDDLIGRSMYDFLAPSDSAQVKLWEDEGLLRTLGPREGLMRRSDGSEFWALISSVPVINEDGNEDGSMGVVIDISARKHTEALLREKQEALEAALEINTSIINSAFDVVCVIDKEGRFVSVSTRAREVWGYEPDEMIGRAYIDFLLPEFVETSLNQFADFVSGRTPQGPLESEFRCKDGRMMPMAASASWNKNHELFFVFMHDLTERKRIEARLEEAQRMQAIGQLTGGVAHDFNNLLTVILGNAEVLSERLKADERAYRLVEATRLAAERGSDLTSRLLSFARRQALTPVSSDINMLVARMEGLIRRMVDDNIEIEVVLDEQLQPAMVDPMQLETAVLNIVVNARDAMPDGGRLTITTANTRLEAADFANGTDVTPGDYVRIMLSDTGIGMNAEAQARAFEPFFTTKPAGERSGLGLSMVHGFIKQSHGHIQIGSMTGEKAGTSVILYLPVGQAAEEAMKSAPAVESREEDGELILLVEDNDLVRAYVEGQLESLGYDVITAEDGPSALALLRANTNISLLFTDIIMPGGLNGRELADEARKLHADIKVLFTSGYSDDTLIHEGRVDEGVQLLSKPYRRNELAQRVRMILGGKE